MDRDELATLLRRSTKIILGLGSNIYRSDSLPDDISNWESVKQYIGNNNQNWFKINNSLFNIIKDKDYFIITTSWDSHLEKTVPHDRIFTPSGNCHKFQCYNACTSQLWDVEAILDQEENPLCPYCQSKLVMNIKTDAFFVRSIYTEQETNYHNWIHKNYNEDIVIIEWEANSADSRIITEPFENITSALPSVKLIRINSEETSIPKMIQEKSTSLKIDIEDVISSLVNY